MSNFIVISFLFVFSNADDNDMLVLLEKLHREKRISVCKKNVQCEGCQKCSLQRIVLKPEIYENKCYLKNIC